MRRFWTKKNLADLLCLSPSQVASYDFVSKQACPNKLKCVRHTITGTFSGLIHPKIRDPTHKGDLFHTEQTSW